MKKRLSLIIALSALGMCLAPVAGQADSLLNQINDLARQRADGAQQKQQQIQTTLAQAKDRTVRQAIDLVQTAQNAAENARSSLLQDLANGKAAVVNQLNCVLENLNTKNTVQGTLNIDADQIPGNKYIRIGSLLPNDSRNLAISYGGGNGPDGYKFSLIDLNNGNQVVRSGPWSDLGLPEITANCDHSQAIVTLQNGSPAVQTDKVVKDISSNTTNALHQGASDLTQQAKSLANTIH